MDEETIEGTLSEEGGNVPPETPSEETKEIPEVPTEEPKEKPEEELFELPDGRKVDAMTLTKEWKENFLPDYTRKSQELAKVSKGDIINKEPEKSPYADPEYVPESYEELLRIAEERALAKIDEREKERLNQQIAIENEVASQLEEVKKIDPSLNENSLFLHATKYGFRDLKVAYQNMKDMNELVKNVQKTTATNIAKRIDPVSVTGTSGGSTPNPSDFQSATEYLRSLKN
jgi:hypothetical protein